MNEKEASPAVTLLAAIVLPVFLAVPASAVAFFPGNVVTSIEITGNRIDERIIRDRLAFREGDVIDAVKIEQSKLNLYSLGLFKSLDIIPERDGSGGTRVHVDARDGWYVLPLPMFGSRGGERYVAGALLEQNILKQGERVSAFASFSDSTSRYMLFTEMNRFTLGGALERRSFTEYRYQDGAYTSQYLTERNTGDLASLGTVVDSYETNATALRLTAGMPLAEKLRGTVGVNLSDVQYDRATVALPGESQKIRALQAGVQYGRTGADRELSGGFGRIFGLGMADLEERLKPLPRTFVDYGARATVEAAGKVLGSDAEFGKVTLAGSRSVNYADRSRLSFSVKGGYGKDLPFGQLFATGRSDGLLGVYAREYRGDRMAAASAAYRRSFLRDRQGQFTGEIFGEYAACFREGQRGEKEGAGFNVAYQFWRFPLPLGFGYTYSFDDNDWRISASFGGTF